MACIQDHGNFKGLSQWNGVSKNNLFTCRMQGQYTFQVLSAWEFAEFLSMRNISSIKVYFSLAPFAFVENRFLCGVDWEGSSALVLKLLKHFHINHWLAGADATCWRSSGQGNITNKPFPILTGPLLHSLICCVRLVKLCFQCGHGLVFYAEWACSGVTYKTCCWYLLSAFGVLGTRYGFCW